MLLVLLSVWLAKAGTTAAGDAIICDSRQIPLGASTAEIGVWVENDIALNAIIIPLEFRSLGTEAYVADTLFVAVQGRLTNWGEEGSGIVVIQYFQDRGYFDFMHTCGEDDGVWEPVAVITEFESPDAVTIVALGIEPATLSPGADTMPSISIKFGILNEVGAFQIDTTCTPPDNHLLFYQFAGGDDNAVTPAFSKGEIEICCSCDCHADPYCDTVYNVFDVVKISQVVNQGYPEPDDPNPCCPYHTTDVDCDDDTDQTDLDKMAAVCFYAADPDTTFCHPCQ
jgi:hypothetical protein